LFSGGVAGRWSGHFRALGNFCRLHIRDGKPAYAEDLTRFFHYATKVAMRYRELSPLLPLLEPLSGVRVGTGFTF
jgi:N-acetylmuramate 1-kinase